MARIKTHYKRFADGGAVDLKVTEHEQPGDASAAFQAQIDALRRAEHFAEVARQPQVGLTERQQKFLDQNPEMLDQPERLGAAILDAHMANHEIDSDAFHEHVAHAFRIQHLETAAHNKASALGHQPGSAEHQRAASDHLDGFIADVNPEPEFYKPKPLPERRPIGIEHMATALAKSDPVIGDTASQRYFQGGGDYDGSNPGRVKLSAQEKEICRALGQDEISYARGKLELQRKKAEGFYDR
jgi:hypothetical protein